MTWRDAKLDSSVSGDFTAEDGPLKFGKTPIIRDIGFLVRCSSTELILCVSICLEDNDYRHYNAIPTAMILDIDPLLPAPRDENIT